MLSEGVLLKSCSAFHSKTHLLHSNQLLFHCRSFTRRREVMMALSSPPKFHTSKVIDSHLHVWASSEEATSRYPYFPGQETSINGSADFLLQCMADAGVDGALIIQPITHMFDHSYVNRVLRTYPTRFIGCCLANPTEGRNGIIELERLVLKDGYRAVRFNPYLWPSGQKMTNEIGKAMFAKAGELGVPVGFMCFKGLLLHISDIEELCTEFPTTTVIIDHLGFCKPPMDDLEKEAWGRLLQLSKFRQVYIKLSAFFRVSRKPYPYDDTSPLLSELITTYGARRLMWGTDFPFVVKECGYKEAKDLIPYLASKGFPISNDDLEWIMGKTAMHLFSGAWVASESE